MKTDCEWRRARPVKRGFHLLRWFLACALLAGVAGRARADYVVKQQTRQVPVINTGVRAPLLDALGSPLPSPPVSYVLLAHDQSIPPGAQGNTLLICLHGAGDTAANFANVWINLMRSHSNLVVVMPEINLLGEFPWDQIAAIVSDTEAKDHVNPRHVILLGHSMGCGQATVVVNARPDLFAGFASISGVSLQSFLTPAMRKYGGTLALYENDGVGEGAKAQDEAFDAAALRYYGFSHVLMETSPRGHNIGGSTFEPDIKRMMTFFDAALAANDKQAAAVAPPSNRVAAPSPPANVVVEQRTLANPAASYVFLTPDRAKVPAPLDSTLLICLHGPGDTGIDFAKNWFGLVSDRTDVVVAVPNSGSLRDMSAAPMIQGIINDTVARDHVNPRHIILVGHDLGGGAAAGVVATHPELIAGFAEISASLSPFGWEGQKFWQKMPVYYAVGSKDEMFHEVFNVNVTQFKQSGFSHLLAESLATGHALTQEEIKHLMTFFDRELAEQDNTNEQPAPPPPPAMPSQNTSQATIKKPNDSTSADGRFTLGLQPAIPGHDVVVETRPLGTSLFPYAVVKSGGFQAPISNSCSLLIFFPAGSGVGDPAPAAKDWVGLVESRPDVVVALPGEHNRDLSMAMITEIIDDTVARDHVNPNHVFIVGYNVMFAPGIWPLVTAQPDLFAGFAFLANMGGIIVTDATRDAMKNRAGKMAAYFAFGAKIDGGDEAVADFVATFKSMGFTHIAADRPDRDSTLSQLPFAQLIKNMMALFDQQLAANRPKETEEASTLSWLAKSMVTEQRSLAKPQGSYVFLTPDRQKFPAAKESTLLICLHGSSESVTNFAKNWADLVKSRLDVVVAIPEAAGGTPRNPWGPESADLVKAIIADTLARDHINPRHVILVGADVGAMAGGTIVGEFPDRFAAFADIGPDFPETFFTPALKENAAKLAVYYASATNDHAIAIPPATRKQFDEFGFNAPRAPQYALTNLLIEKFDIAGDITPDEFKFRITRLMRFFDGVLENNDAKEKKAAEAARNKD